MSVKICSSSGNVFADLGLGEEGTKNLWIRSTLMSEVRKLIEKHGLIQGGAAELMGASQLRISGFMRGNIDLFSINHLGQHARPREGTVEIVLSPA
jgi:predicted XRE-type DNA-binding protein